MDNSIVRSQKKDGSFTETLKDGVNKIRFTFSNINYEQKKSELNDFWRRISGRKQIRLAVVGSPSSGKSFLLQDIMTALNSMAARFSRLERDGLEYVDFKSYKPDELGGNGQTPFYVCRQSNHYGASVEHVGRNGFSYDMDFLNIPGEAFKNDSSETYSRVEAYLRLRDKLYTSRRLFMVSTFIDETGEKKLIVEPRIKGKLSPLAEIKTQPPILSDSNPSGHLGGNKFSMSFRDWKDIIDNLNGFNYCQGSSKIISGKKLLKHFFKYDTDSVIRSIEDLMEGNMIKDLPFDHNDFMMTGYARAFVFLHYCSLATDIVVCDRIYVPQNQQPNDNTNNQSTEIPFGDLSKNISAFVTNRKDKSVHVYLAFRNVDFLLQAKEDLYKKLATEFLATMIPEARRNAIYSIFNSIVLYKMDSTLGKKIEDNFNYFIGLPREFDKEELIDNKTTGSSFMDKLANTYMDSASHSGIIVHRTRNLITHIESRIGAPGMAFRGVLLQTGINTQNETIVPHVYFTCTPITNDFSIYENFESEGRIAPDFCHKGDTTDLFMSRNSNVCFGSYQLCMDILKQHKMGSFIHGSLLRHLMGLTN